MMATDPRESGIACACCGLPVPIDLAVLIGDGGGDSDMIPVVVPPPGWFPDPDDPDRLLCGLHVTNLQAALFWAQEKQLAGTTDTDRDVKEPTSPAGRAMLGLPPAARRPPPADPDDEDEA